MKTPENTSEETLVAIESLVLFFYNYISTDITYLRSVSRDFDYVWGEYVQGSKRQTFGLLWEMWQSKWNIETKLLLLDYAKRQQGAFAANTVNNALLMRDLGKGGTSNG